MKNILSIFILIGNMLCYNNSSFAQGGIITTIAGNGTAGSAGDGGQATAAQIKTPQGIVFDASGNLIFADWSNRKIRKINSAGIITTICGIGIEGYSGDGGPASLAQIGKPAGIAIDHTGNLYIPDADNNCIRKISTAGIITTIAGNGFPGYTGDGGLAASAELNYPYFISFDSTGNLIFTDNGNNCIRKINTAGIITTIAGNGISGDSGDGGPATAAEFNYPLALAIDRNKNIYITDDHNNKVRKVDSFGTITTIAGTGAAGFSGDGGPATAAVLNYPSTVSILDTSGNVYICDQNNNRIRVVNASGVINTIFGTGTAGYSGDGGLASVAEIYAPWFITKDSMGNFYIADQSNNRLRKITHFPTVSVAASPGDTICTSTAVTYSATVTNGDTVNYQWYVNNSAITGETNSSYTYTPANGDSIMCRCIDSSPAFGIDTSISNALHMVVNPTTTDTLSIIAVPSFKVCNGTAATYSVTGGATPYQWVVDGSFISGATSNSYTYFPANGDSIRCTTTGACNSGGICNTIDMIVAANITPTVSITASPTATAAGSVVTVTATFSVTGSYIINWYDNGILLGTTTTNSITYTETGDTDHITATIIPASGFPDCYDSAISNVVVVTDSTLGTSPLTSPQVERVYVYPNPASGVLTIKTDGSSYGFLAVTNTLGVVLLHQEIIIGVTNVDIKALPAGMYFVYMITEHNPNPSQERTTVVRKFVKE